MYVPNAGSSQEVSITTSQSLAESDTDGVTVNVISKDGGNVFKGSFFGAGSTTSMQGSNFDAGLQAAQLKAPNSLKNYYDYEGTLGGPILKDKLWFFGGSRYHGDTKYVAGMFSNQNAGDITKWTYSPDLSNQALNDEYWLTGYAKLTWQATPRNKITAYYEDALRCTTCNFGGSATASPETSGHGATHPDGLSQLTWTSPLTNRVLFEAGFSFASERWGSDPRPGFDPALINVQAVGGNFPGLSYRAPAPPTSGAGGPGEVVHWNVCQSGIHHVHARRTLHEVRGTTARRSTTARRRPGSTHSAIGLPRRNPAACPIS